MLPFETKVCLITASICNSFVTTNRQLRHHRISAKHFFALAGLLLTGTRGQYYESEVIGVDKFHGSSDGFLSDTAALLDEINWCFNKAGTAFRRIGFSYTNGETQSTSHTCHDEHDGSALTVNLIGSLSDKVFTNVCWYGSTSLSNYIRLDYDGGSIDIGTYSASCTDLPLP